MARSVKVHEYAEKRNAILDVAQRHIATKGYEQMKTQDLLEDLQISRGAFYHYFDSKEALLFAVVERIVDQLEQLVLPIIQNPGLSALEKLQRFFIALDQRKRENRPLVLAFMRVWYADENSIVRHRLYMTRIKRFTPWLEAIIQEGVAEGAFTTPYPDQAARMIMSLLEDLGYASVELLLAEEGDLPALTRIVEATADALERLLGAETGCLRETWSEGLSLWLASPSKGEEGQPVQPS